MKPGHDRPYRGVHDLGDRQVAVADDIGVIDHHPERLRQRFDRFDDLVVWQPFECLDLCRAVTHRDVSLPRGVLPVGDLITELLHRPTQGLAIVVDPGVVHDPHQPRLEVRTFAELAKAGVGPQHGVLHEVLGIGATAGQPPGRAVQHVKHRDGIALESLTDALPDREVDADLTQTVLAETGGNPYLVVAVADAIRAGDTPGVTAPDSVRRQITRRLSRLHPATQPLATAASVLGDASVLSDAVRLAGLRPDEGRAAADELVAAHLLASADPILFGHRIVRMTIHDMLEPRKRIAFHAYAAN